MFANTPSEFGGPAVAPLPAPSGQQNLPGQTPQQAFEAQHPAQPAPQAVNPTQQRLEVAIRQLRHVKSECQQATNPYTIRDRLVQVIEVMEYILAGNVATAESNQVPGHAPQPDPNRARVQIIGQVVTNEGGPFVQPQPSAPINSSDVKFIPAPNGSFSVEGGSGQAVQFYDGPAGSPYAGGGNAGQRVEFFDGPGATAPAAEPAPIAPPQAQAPVSNSPAATFAPTAPTLSTEAGGEVPPMGVPSAASFAEAIAARPPAMPIPTL